MTQKPSNTYTTVTVHGSPNYNIYIGSNLLTDEALFASSIRGRHVLIISDENVFALYGKQLQDTLNSACKNLFIKAVVVPPGESSKSLKNFAHIMHTLAAQKATRDSCIIALGGGVVGDLAGFAAACWMRGIDYIQVPTSLLAMVDSSVGGKTAVDLPEGKNLVGAFFAPRAVIIDINTLNSLPSRALNSGFAEVIKYGAIANIEFFYWLTHSQSQLQHRDHSALAYAIECSCKQKADIVSRDFKEHGERALLNFGHTFAHALETAQGYATNDDTAFMHGEAVSIGMVCAAKLATQLNMASQEDCVNLERVLQAFALPTALPDTVDKNTLIQNMLLDKKNTALAIRCILWQGIGKACVKDNVDLEAVMRSLQ